MFYIYYIFNIDFKYRVFFILVKIISCFRWVFGSDYLWRGRLMKLRGFLEFCFENIKNDFLDKL